MRTRYDLQSYQSRWAERSRTDSCPWSNKFDIESYQCVSASRRVLPWENEQPSCSWEENQYMNTSFNERLVLEYRYSHFQVLMESNNYIEAIPYLGSIDHASTRALTSGDTKPTSQFSSWSCSSWLGPKGLGRFNWMLSTSCPCATSYGSLSYCRNNVSHDYSAALLNWQCQP